MNSDRNLDIKCAACGNNIAGIEGISHPLVNNALAVLLEQGIYALFLFLCSRGSKEKQPAESTGRRLFILLTEVMSEHNNGGSSFKCNELLKNVREKFCTDLDKTYLARDVAEQALIYARYHLKANE